jgi:hypothetical protein
MPFPDGGLITETNQQYYEGAQPFKSATGLAGESFQTSFNTNLVFGSWDENSVEYSLNNFKIYTSNTGLQGSFTEYLLPFTVKGNTITITGVLPALTYIVVQLKILTGGKYGQTEDEKAYGQVVEDNYGGYSYITLNDVINNFLIAYVGAGKLVTSIKRTDLIFHAKRGLQEFSFDTLKSIKTSELTIPPSLTLPLPQDYVNYVRTSWIDRFGVKHIIYPTNNLTDSPYYTNIQDSTGIPTQDNFGDNVEGTSIIQERWHSAGDAELNNYLATNPDTLGFRIDGNGSLIQRSIGQQYGLDTQYAQVNGYFNLNEREGKMSFSSGLVNNLILLEYISDGLAYDMDSRVPKMAEDALYAYILHAIISTRINQPEYVVQRLKKEKSAKLRNAKIRLSNIKLDEITQVMRGKSKWIKH